MVCRLMTRDSIEAFYTCFTHCFIPGEHEKEAHCVVQVCPSGKESGQE